MLRAQQALHDYEDSLKTSQPDPKRFKQLFARAQVCAQEYLALVGRDLKEKYLDQPPKAKQA
jgi:hypothetical protein